MFNVEHITTIVSILNVLIRCYQYNIIEYLIRFYILYSTFYILYFIFYILHFIFYILHSYMLFCQLYDNSSQHVYTVHNVYTSYNII